MKQRTKHIIFVVIAAILLVAAAVTLLSERETVGIRANLIFVNGGDTPVGSVQVSYTLWDGSPTSEGGQNADNSLMERGEKLYFEVNWPVVVRVYADLQGKELLGELVVEDKAETGYIQHVLWNGTALTSVELIP